MRKALIDISGVLLAHGFCYFPIPTGGHLEDVPDDFDLAPKEWKLVSGEWEAYQAPVIPPSPPTKEELMARLNEIMAQIQALQ